MNSAIKLYSIGTMEDGTEKFQSQLCIGKDICDFIRKKEDNIMRVYDRGENGFGFYPYNKPFIIVDNITDMLSQPL